MQTLNLKLGGSRTETPCADHTGREFPSISAMCRAWGIPPAHYHSRRRRGWSLERALTVLPGTRAGGICDHLGRWYPTREAMRRAWGLSRDAYAMRRRRGWSLERTLTEPSRDYSRKITDPENGAEYRSIADFARAVGVLPATMASRLRRGKLPPDVLAYDGCLCSTPSRDHLGNDFPSMAAMARHYGLSVCRLGQRLRKGWPIARALTTPVASSSKKEKNKK